MFSKTLVRVSLGCRAKGWPGLQPDACTALAFAVACTSGAFALARSAFRPHKRGIRFSRSFVKEGLSKEGLSTEGLSTEGLWLV